MSVASKHNAYVAALGWATEFIRNKKDHVVNGLSEIMYDRIAQAQIRVRGEWEKTSPGSAFGLLSPKFPLDLMRDVGIVGLAESKPEMDSYLRGISAALIERGAKLPQPLAEFVAASLREPTVPQRRGPKAQFWRDMMIGNTVQYIHKTWGFQLTRRRDAKKKVHCATSIVMEAMAANKVGLSDDGVRKAYEKSQRFMKEMKPLLSEKVVAILRKHKSGNQSEPALPSDAMPEFLDAMAPEIVKLISNMRDNPDGPRDLIDEWVGRIERRKPGYIQLDDRPWVTDRRK